MSLPRHTQIRIASLGAVVLLVESSPGPLFWESLVYAIAFGHYVLALGYSRRQLSHLATEPSTFVPLVGLVVAGGLLYAGLSVAAYFAVHHVLNEVYLLDRVTRRADAAEVRRLRRAGLVLHLLLYITLVRRSTAFAWLDSEMLFGALGLAYVAYGFAFWSARGRLGPAERVDNMAGEIVGFGLAVASLWVHIGVLQVACYHFVFWLIQPVAARRRGGSEALATYLGLTALVTGGWFLLSPAVPVGWPLPLWLYREVFVALSFAHITLSFALSSANPAWLRRVFEPSGAARSP